MKLPNKHAAAWKRWLLKASVRGAYLQAKQRQITAKIAAIEAAESARVA